MEELMTNSKYMLVSYSGGLRVVSFSTLEELLPMVMSRYSMEVGLDKLQILLTKTMDEFRSEEIEEEQEETGRCAYCGHPMLECNCDCV